LWKSRGTFPAAKSTTAPRLAEANPNATERRPEQSVVGEQVERSTLAARFRRGLYGEPRRHEQL
jgi:hypothetical protein